MTNNSTPYIVLIADYGKGDPAFVEVKQHISALIPNARIEEVSVEPFSTIQTGFWAHQFAINHSVFKSLKRGGNLMGVGGTFLYINTAPRKDDLSPREDNGGERLVYAKLSNGVEVVGVLSGESFSYIKPLITELREINISRNGSQFRSRDTFPIALRAIVKKSYEGILGDEIDNEAIPDRTMWRVAHVDGYGNLKLSTMCSEAGFEEGEPLKIRVGNLNRYVEAVYSKGIFAVKENQLCLAPGSSGIKGENFLEISKRGASAWDVLGKPKTGAEVAVERFRSKAKTLA
ncbi:MAG: hypothetical protein KGH67_05610 [Candidatus Micrarchaeota archaeon]|nr:hypothetical protein [Candidatus Micrarchaeota archaeon]MDE1859972.1 hypothetical protein [Candidatus Micrarchaeota archaeon]